jgi:diguanylate cyclase (GGDEF)-like protein
MELAERLRTKVAGTDFENADVMPQGRFTISIGVAVYPEDAATKPELIEKADQALYRAKASGKNCEVAHEDD